jgi:hypothetical protein
LSYQLRLLLLRRLLRVALRQQVVAAQRALPVIRERATATPRVLIRVLGTALRITRLLIWVPVMKAAELTLESPVPPRPAERVAVVFLPTVRPVVLAAVLAWAPA